MVDPMRRFEFAEPLPVIPPGKLPFSRYNLPMADATWTPLQHKLRETLALGDCPLCRLVEQDEQAFLRSLTYERILDIPTRETLQKARGLCAPHARAWRAVQGCALPVALVYRPIIKDLLAQTEPKTAAGWLSRRASPRRLGEKLDAAAPCPACSVGEATARRYAEVLLQEVGVTEARAGEVRAALIRDGGLCLPHLRLALQVPGPAAGYQALLAAQREAWSALMAELDEFIRKNDYRFQHEPMGDERDSWLRALDALVGMSGE